MDETTDASTEAHTDEITDGITDEITGEATVSRSVELDADTEEVWRAIEDDGERSAWFEADTELDVVEGGRGRIVEHDGTRREVRVDRVEPGRMLRFDWWTDDGPPSRVEMVIVPLDGNGSRLTVTESRPVASTACTVAPRLLALELLMLCRVRV